MKNFLKVVAGLVVFFSLAVGALTFMRNLNRQPSVILTSTECDPPCWYGITPGHSTSSEVYAILEELDSLDKNSIRDAYDPRGRHTEIFWFFRRPTEDNAGSIYLDNEQAIAINILAIYSLRLADLFEKIGQPESYWVEIGRGENREFLEVYLLYPSIGCVATVIVDIEGNTSQVELHETTSIYRVTYFAPEMYPELLETRTLIDKPVKAHTGSFQAWSGFGTIEFERERKQGEPTVFMMDNEVSRLFIDLSTVWTLWYRDLFDRESPPSIEVTGRDILEGLYQLWLYTLREGLQDDDAEFRVYPETMLSAGAISKSLEEGNLE